MSNYIGTEGGILALDLGAKTGVAVADENGDLCWWSTLKFHKLPLNERVEALHEQINRLIRMHRPRLIASEKVIIPSGRRGANWEGLAWLEGILCLAARQNRVPWIRCWPNSLKKHCTGSGRAKKDDMVAWAVTAYSLNVTPGHDAADALGLISWARCQQQWRDNAR